MAVSSQDPDDSLPPRLFEAVEGAVTGKYTKVDISTDDIIAIARSNMLQMRLAEIIDNNHNNPDIAKIKKKLLYLLASTATDLKQEARGHSKYMDFVDRSVLALGVTTTGSGLVLLINAGTLALGPAGLLIGGVVSLFAGAVGRTVLKHKSDETEYSIEKMQLLATLIKEI